MYHVATSNQVGEELALIMGAYAHDTLDFVPCLLSSLFCDAVCRLAEENSSNLTPELKAVESSSK